MTHNIEETVESLREENLELKLGSIKKELATFKVDMHRHLDLILEQTSKTNGSVARAMERINALEREDNKRKIESLQNEVKDYKTKTKFWYTISTNKWIAGLIAACAYAFTIQEFRAAFFGLFKIGG